MAVLPGQAQITRLERRYDKYTVLRIHIHRIFPFQKISKPYHGWLFEIRRAGMGGGGGGGVSLNWKSEGMGGYL